MAPQKRTRIDPTALVPSGEDKQSPLANALRFIDTHVASLLPGLATIFGKLGHQHLLLLTQRIQRQEMIDKLTHDDTFLPRSARIKFDLSMPKAVKEDPEYLTLKGATEELVTNFQQQLKGQIKEGNKLALKHVNVAIDNNLAYSLFHMASAHLTAAPDTPTDLNTQSHKLVNTLLDVHHEEILKYSSTTDLDAFRTLYKKHLGIASLPTPDQNTITDLTDSPTRRNSTSNAGDFSIGLAITTGDGRVNENTTRDPASRKARLQLMEFKRLVESLLLVPFDVYNKERFAIQQALNLKKLETEIFTTKSTEDATMEIDQEGTATPQLIKELIEKRVAAKTSNLTKEINKMQRTIAKLSTGKNTKSELKNNQRGHGGASKQKETATDKTTRGRPNHTTPANKTRTKSPRAQGPDNDTGKDKGRNSNRQSPKPSKKKNNRSSTTRNNRSRRSSTGSK